jgi:hypothetical protein
MKRERSRWFLPAILVSAMALVLAACPEDEPIVEDDPDPTPPEEEVALDASCTNEEVGYEVDYPAEWNVNEDNIIPACSVFDPGRAELPEVGEIPADLAVVIREQRVEFDRVTDFEGDPTIEVLSQEETTVDGRSAYVVEYEHTGEGMYPEGMVTYGYFVNIEPFTLTAITHDLEEAEPPSYDERKEILDAMMASLTFIEAEPEEDDDEEPADDA